MNKDSINRLPSARKDQLIVKELDGEVLVYDLQRDKAHCLNSTAGLVWKYCDGKTGVDEIAKCLGAETQTVVDDRIVWLALDQLASFDLLEKAPTTPGDFAGLSRRQMMKTAGIAAIALPVVISIIAPTPAQAASGILFHTPCCTGDTCAPGNGTCIPHPNAGACLMWCG